MKKMIAAAMLSFVLFSCTDTKKQEKDLLDKVIEIHDVVMAKDGQVMANKMQLDTMLAGIKDPAVNAAANRLISELNKADARMENWMHNFDAENKGKSHQEVMNYLTNQKKQIEAIDKQLSSSLTASGKLIQENKAK